MKKIIFLSLILFNSLNANLIKDIKVDETEKQINELPYIKVDTPIVNEDGFLPMFSNSCNSIKYTGAVEQVLIEEVQNIRKYLEDISDPFVKFTKLEAVVASISFTSCLAEMGEDEVKGSETSSSLAEITPESTGIGNNQVVVNVGVTTGSGANVEGEADTNTNFAPQDIASKAIEKKGEEGAYTEVIQCMNRKREEIYLKLYETLSYDLNLKFKMSSAMNSQCNIQLKKDDEIVPSWGEFTGIDFDKYKEKMNNSIDDNKMTSFIKNTMNEIVDISFNDSEEDKKTKICVKYNDNSECIEEVEIEKKKCIEENGEIKGDCRCINGVDVINGNSCSTPEDYEFNKKYGIKDDGVANDYKDEKISKIEKVFINSIQLNNFKYYKDLFDYFYDNDVIFQKYSVQSETKEGKFFQTFKLSIYDNFNIKTKQYNDVDKIYYKDFLIKEEKSNKIILKGSDFDNNLINYLAMQECNNDTKCVFNLKRQKLLEKTKFENVLNNYIDIKNKYKNDVNFYSIFTNSNPNIDTFKNKFFTIKKTIKEIYEKYNKNNLKFIVKRNLFIGNSFFVKWNLNMKSKLEELKLKGDLKNYNLFKDFNTVFNLNLSSNDEDTFTTLNKQLLEMSDMKEEDRNMNMDFIKTNSIIKNEKQKNLSIF